MRARRRRGMATDIRTEASDGVVDAVGDRGVDQPVPVSARPSNPSCREPGPLGLAGGACAGTCSPACLSEKCALPSAQELGSRPWASSGRRHKRQAALRSAALVVRRGCRLPQVRTDGVAGSHARLRPPAPVVAHLELADPLASPACEIRSAVARPDLVAPGWKCSPVVTREDDERVAADLGAAPNGRRTVQAVRAKPQGPLPRRLSVRELDWPRPDADLRAACGRCRLGAQAIGRGSAAGPAADDVSRGTFSGVVERPLRRDARAAGVPLGEGCGAA